MKLNRPYHKLFDVWDEMSSYILGFWMADGCITLRKHRAKYYKIFRLFNTNLQLITNMSDLLGVKYYTERQPGQHKRRYEIGIFSDSLFDFCYNVTNTVHKSHHKYTLPNVPQVLFHHFLRGFFDGDGSICYKHYKNRHGRVISALTTSFTGGNETNHLEQLRDWLRDNVGLGNKKITGSLSRKLIYNQYDSMLLCEFMYKDATILMKCKKDIWDAADKTKLCNSTKYFSNKV